MLIKIHIKNVFRDNDLPYNETKNTMNNFLDGETHIVDVLYDCVLDEFVKTCLY